MRIGERIYNLQRCYNALHGITRADDRLPRRFSQEPSPSGNAAGETIDLEVQYDPNNPAVCSDEIVTSVPKCRPWIAGFFIFFCMIELLLLRGLSKLILR